VVWNGTPLVGPAVGELFQRIPPTQHTVMCFDCQPVKSDMTVQVQGKVVYGTETNPRPFAQHFILSPDMDQPGNYYVAHDVFRLV
jgi:NTF2-related export protein 1/2